MLHCVLSSAKEVYLVSNLCSGSSSFSSTNCAIYTANVDWTVHSVAELDGTNKPYQHAVGPTGAATGQAVMTGTFMLRPFEEFD